MSAPKVDVLAVMDAELERQRIAVLNGHHNADAMGEFEEVREALADVIVADMEYEYARRSLNTATNGDPNKLSEERWKKVYDRFERAVMRRADALGRIRGRL